MTTRTFSQNPTVRLMRRASVLFPFTPYASRTAVRHARREWVRSVLQLRQGTHGSRWILDQPVARRAA